MKHRSMLRRKTLTDVKAAITKANALTRAAAEKEDALDSLNTKKRICNDIYAIGLPL